jgi:hypothetical protein
MFMQESERIYTRWGVHKYRAHGYYHNPPDPAACPICAMYQRDLARVLEWEQRQESLPKEEE